MSRRSTGRKGSTESNEFPPLHLVYVDQAPLRDRVAGECSEAMLRLEEARAGWHHFERKDKPAFTRWRAREFGALLSRSREVEIQIRDSQALIHEVEMEMRRGFQDAHRAYQRVMFRRANPSADPVEEQSEGENRGAARKLSDFEKEALFQEWVKRSLGTNPDKMDDEAYSASFEAFKSHMFRPPAEEPPPPNLGRPRAPERPNRPAEPAPGPEFPEETDARVKELYRRLVRRLHPDLRADGSAAVSALWHEVQEAYAASDVARMEILLALSDIETRRTAGQSLSQMQAVRTELERALQRLEKSLLEAEGEDAWDFARLGPTPGLRTRVERELKSDLAGRSRRLDLLTRAIAEWAAGPVLNRTVRVAR
ncbi:MAG: J domain-containing protein [Verrucomicrobiota bacterium]|nr:J domain-containing protein [Verrucomicrobiota bacterium]